MNDKVLGRGPIKRPAKVSLGEGLAPITAAPRPILSPTPVEAAVWRKEFDAWSAANPGVKTQREAERTQADFQSDLIERVEALLNHTGCEPTLVGWRRLALLLAVELAECSHGSLKPSDGRPKRPAGAPKIPAFRIEPPTRRKQGSAVETYFSEFAAIDGEKTKSNCSLKKAVETVYGRLPKDRKLKVKTAKSLEKMYLKRQREINDLESRHGTGDDFLRAYSDQFVPNGLKDHGDAWESFRWLEQAGEHYTRLWQEKAAERVTSAGEDER